ncbi:unnamed protein product [Malus baccata var. baccata]
MGFSGIKPNEFTFLINLKESGFVGIAENGMQIHNICIKSGVEWVTVVSNFILDMYAKCEKFRKAAQIFNVMPVKNLISWNAMIVGFTLEGNGERALVLLRKMQGLWEVPDEYTITSTLKACSGLGAIQQGSQIHSSLITRGFPCSVQTTVAEHNLLQAMDLFRQLRVSIDHQVDEFVLSSLMGVFADFAFIEQGKQMHAFTIKIPCGLDILVTNSILDMYLKCGLTDEAERLFYETPMRNVISWTIMITGYGKHGLGRKSIYLFNQMLSDDIEPDGVT